MAAGINELPLLGGIATVAGLIARRLLVAVPLVFVVMTLTFLLLRLAPGDPAVNILGSGGNFEEYHQLRQQMGLDLPIGEQYVNFLSGLFHGDIGTSLYSSRPAVDFVLARLPVTLYLTVGATLVSLVAGVGFGIFSALRTGIGGRSVQVLSIVGQSVPDFWLGLLLIVLFAVKLRWFPPNGFVPLLDSPGAWLAHLALPVLTLGLSSMGAVARMTRSAMVEVLNRDFVRTLRANGCSETSIVFRHALKNAAIPVVTVVGLRFIGMLSSAVIIEQIFALPGVGSLAVQSASKSDYPVMQALVMYMTISVVAVNLVVDVLYGWLNPKVRAS